MNQLQDYPPAAVVLYRRCWKQSVQPVADWQCPYACLHHHQQTEEAYRASDRLWHGGEWCYQLHCPLAFADQQATAGAPEQTKVPSSIFRRTEKSNITRHTTICHVARGNSASACPGSAAYHLPQTFGSFSRQIAQSYMHFHTDRCNPSA